MKYFIVNVNNCLPMSQYAPFFYEHIGKGELVMLEDIEDTSQLEKTYLELLAHTNRKPFPKLRKVVLLFIPRDFAMPLRPQDYELYNDINTYMHLLQLLDDDYMIYTFYVDRTGELEQNDAVYQKLNAVNHSLQAKYPELTSHFLTMGDAAGEGDYRRYLESRIGLLCDCMQPFYTYMLKSAPEVERTPAQFQNGVNHYIGEARKVLSEVRHIYAPIYRVELAEEIEEYLKIVCYIKKMIQERLTPEQLPAYESYGLSEIQTEQIRRLLATYRGRLSLWEGTEPAISKQGVSSKWEFRASTNAAAAYHEQLNGTIENRLKKLNVGNVGSKSVVDGIFRDLNDIITNAWRDLLSFTEKQSKILLDPESYQKVSEEPFHLEDSDREDKELEVAMLEKTNKHSPGAADIPDFSAENRLEQELEQTNHQMDQIIENLKVYNIRTFALAFLFAVLAVAGLYVGAQYSFFVKENTWWIFTGYLLVSGAVFATAYLTVRRRYKKEIELLLGECVTKVADFLRSFQLIAENFEANIQMAGRYNCLKRQLDARAAARKEYLETMQKCAWHKMKVKQLLRNLTYFDSFIGDAFPYEEGTVTLDSFDHDAEHTEFYYLKVFRR